jgi:hypothetical protein
MNFLFRRQGEITVQPFDLLAKLLFLGFRGNIRQPDSTGNELIESRPVIAFFDSLDQEPFLPVRRLQVGDPAGLESRPVADRCFAVHEQLFQNMSPMEFHEFLLRIQIIRSPFHPRESRGFPKIAEPVILGDDFVALSAPDQLFYHVGISPLSGG